MYAKCIPLSTLTTNRLDSDFYRPEYLAIAECLEKHRTVELGSLGKFFAGPFGSKLPSNLYLDDGIPLFRVGNIGLFELDLRNLAHLNPVVHSELRSSEVLPGDLLIVKASVGEKVAKLPPEIPKANITQHIIAMRPNQEVDVDYISAFLFSNCGRMQLQRFSLGSIIQYLGINDARLVVCLDISPTAQEYIGDKIRQAERLRAWASIAETEVSSFHQRFIPTQSNLDFSRKSRRTTPSIMTDRFDAHFYPAVMEDYRLTPNVTFKPLRNLTTNVFNGQTQEETDEDGALEQVTVANLSPLFLSGASRNVKASSDSSRYLRSLDILMCNAAHNKSYIGKELTFCHSDKVRLPSTEVMVIRVDQEKIPASFIREFLLTKIGYTQIQSTIRGITAHSYPSDVAMLQIPIPKVPESEKEQWFSSDDKLIAAGNAYEFSSQLTLAAKFIVEALVAGMISEEELEQSKQELVAGNIELDQQILSRLTKNGIDAEGERLFQNLGAMYELISKSETETEDE